MKKLLLTSAFVIATAGGALAGGHSQQAMMVDNLLSTYAMNVDVSSLTEDQVAELYLALTSTDDRAEAQQKVEAVLNDGNVAYEMEDDIVITVNTPRSTLRAAVQAKATELGIEDVPLRTLTDEQLTQLYLLGNGSESASVKMTKAEGIIAN